MNPWKSVPGSLVPLAALQKRADVLSTDLEHCRSGSFQGFHGDSQVIHRDFMVIHRDFIVIHGDSIVIDRDFMG